jgi:hypothetical protein
MVLYFVTNYKTFTDQYTPTWMREVLISIHTNQLGITSVQTFIEFYCKHLTKNTHVKMLHYVATNGLSSILRRLA